MSNVQPLLEGAEIDDDITAESFSELAVMGHFFIHGKLHMSSCLRFRMQPSLLHEPVAGIPLDSDGCCRGFLTGISADGQAVLWLDGASYPVCFETPFPSLQVKFFAPYSRRMTKPAYLLRNADGRRRRPAVYVRQLFINSRTGAGHTPLYMAAARGWFELVRSLLRLVKCVAMEARERITTQPIVLHFAPLVTGS